jgi:hypothetical protein
MHCVDQTFGLSILLQNWLYHFERKTTGLKASGWIANGINIDLEVALQI